MGKFLAAYAAWVVLVNTTAGPWKKWSRGTIVDKWTYTHLVWGGIANVMGLSLKEITALGVINEIGEGVIRKERPDLTWGEAESVPNITVDIVANPVGWMIVEKLRKNSPKS